MVELLYKVEITSGVMMVDQSDDLRHYLFKVLEGQSSSRTYHAVKQRL